MFISIYVPCSCVSSFCTSAGENAGEKFQWSHLQGKVLAFDIAPASREPQACTRHQSMLEGNYERILYPVSPYDRVQQILQAIGDNPKPFERNVTLEKGHSNARKAYHGLPPQSGIG